MNGRGTAVLRRRERIWHVHDDKEAASVDCNFMCRINNADVRRFRKRLGLLILGCSVAYGTNSQTLTILARSVLVQLRRDDNFDMLLCLFSKLVEPWQTCANRDSAPAFIPHVSRDSWKSPFSWMQRVM